MLLDWAIPAQILRTYAQNIALSPRAPTAASALLGKALYLHVPYQTQMRE